MKRINKKQIKNREQVLMGFPRWNAALVTVNEVFITNPL